MLKKNISGKTRRDYILCLVTVISFGLNLTMISVILNTSCNKNPSYERSITNGKLPKHKNTTMHFVCPYLNGGLGNNMFMYASAYGIAKAKNMTLGVFKSEPIWNIFHLSATKMKDNTCNNAKTKGNKMDCAYDTDMLQLFVDQSVRLVAYLQSWVYFSQVEEDIRRQFTFHPNIEAMVRNLLQKSKQNSVHSANISDVTLIGVHVRRGDYLEKGKREFGYRTAPASYFEEAMDYFRDRFAFPLFLVMTNPNKEDRTWCQNNINGSDVIYIFGNNAEVDLCTLSNCNHVIMSVGSFGWWGSWLANGTTIYYSNFTTDGSKHASQFSQFASDYIYPNWIGLQ